MRARSWIPASTAAAVALLSAAFAVAQTPPGPPADGPRAERLQQMREHRMAALEALLQLRPDQEAAFAAFKAALTPPDGRRRETERPPGELTTPQMLERRAMREAEMKARMDRISSAILTFYAALSPEQQKAFDTIAREHRMHGPGMGGMGMDGRHMGDRHMMGPPPPPPPG